MVDSARRYYKEYPTIVNNIPKDANHYNNTLADFARIDNNLAASQRAIGESSNLAQIALSYTYNFDDQVLYDNVCILSVLAQCAIDNAKRKYDIDIAEEIKLIKQSMLIDQRGYPSFWSLIRPKFDKKKINKQLKCPMNYVYRLKPKSYKPATSTLPIKDFFIKHELNEQRRISKKVETLIEKYSITLLGSIDNNVLDNEDDYYLLSDDFDKLIEDIKQIYISKNYLGMMSRLINRAFIITPELQSQRFNLESRLKNNRAILLKTLYCVNADAFLLCFKSKN